MGHAIFFHEHDLAYFHTHICAPNQAGCASIGGPTSITGSSTKPGVMHVGVLLPETGHLAAVPAMQGRRPDPDRAVHPEGSMSRARIIVWSAGGDPRDRGLAPDRLRARGRRGRPAAGGPRRRTDPIWIAAVALPASAAVAGVGAWLVAIGVRERCALDLARWAAPAPLRPARIAARAAALGLVTNLGFALVESCIHYHEGLGWMGLRCIRGPVHADAAPILVGLSLVVAALVTAADHVLAALRRAAARRALARRPRPAAALPRPLPRDGRPCRRARVRREPHPRAALLPPGLGDRFARGRLPREGSTDDLIKSPPRRPRRGGRPRPCGRPRVGAGRPRARLDQPARREDRRAAAVHARRPDREGGRDHDPDRADRPVRGGDRLVRARAGLDAARQPDRLR